MDEEGVWDQGQGQSEEDGDNPAISAYNVPESRKPSSNTRSERTFSDGSAAEIWMAAQEFLRREKSLRNVGF